MVRLRGLVGRVKFQGLKVISSDLQEGEEIVKFINQEIEELQDAARELGFGKLNGFSIFGEERSLSVMKGEALLVDTDRADWQQLFGHFTYWKGYCVLGVILIFLASILSYIAFFTGLLDYFAPEPRAYLPALLYLIGAGLLTVAKSRWAYRL
jgi:hypothetical protein